MIVIIPSEGFMKHWEDSNGRSNIKPKLQNLSALITVVKAMREGFTISLLYVPIIFITITTQMFL